MTQLKKIPEFIANSNLFIAACAYFFTEFCRYAMAIHDVNAQLLSLLVALSVFVIYCVQRLYFVKIRPAITLRENWYSRNFKLIASLSAIAAAGICIMLLYFPAKLILLFIPPGAVSLLYYLGPFPLRSVFMMKAFVIGFVWSFTCVFIPYLLFKPNVELKYVLCMAAGAFAFVASLCIPFDIRDVEEDKTRRIKSIPVIIGVNPARIIGVVLALLFPLFFWLGNAFDFLLSACAVTAMLTIFIILNSNPSRQPFYFSLLTDGMLIVPWLVIMLIRFSFQQ